MHNRIEKCEMHAEVERPAGAPASLRLDSRSSPSRSDTLERGLPEAQDVSLPPWATQGGVMCARNHVLGSPTSPLRSSLGCTLPSPRAGAQDKAGEAGTPSPLGRLSRQAL